MEKTPTPPQTNGPSSTPISKNSTKCANKRKGNFTANEIIAILEKCQGSLEISYGDFHLKYQAQGPAVASNPSQVEGADTSPTTPNTSPDITTSRETALEEAVNDNLLLTDAIAYEQSRMDFAIGEQGNSSNDRRATSAS